MATVVGLGVNHILDTYEDVYTILDEESPDAIILEQHIVSFLNCGEQSFPDTGEVKRRSNAFLAGELPISLVDYGNRSYANVKIEESGWWEHHTEPSNWDRTKWVVAGKEVIWQRDVPSVGVNLGDFVWFKGDNVEQCAAINYAREKGIPFLAGDIPLAQPLGSMDYVLFEPDSYRICRHPLEDQLGVQGRLQVIAARTDWGVRARMKWNHADQWRNAYAAGVARDLIEHAGLRKICVIFGLRHFDKKTLGQKLSRDDFVPQTILDFLSDQDTCYRDVVRMHNPCSK